MRLKEGMSDVYGCGMVCFGRTVGYYRDRLDPDEQSGTPVLQRLVAHRRVSLLAELAGLPLAWTL